jgi:hypothetical protein
MFLMIRSTDIVHVEVATSAPTTTKRKWEDLWKKKRRSRRRERNSEPIDHALYFVHTSVVEHPQLWDKFLYLVAKAFPPGGANASAAPSAAQRQQSAQPSASKLRPAQFPPRHDIILSNRHTDDQVADALRAVQLFNNLPLDSYPNRVPDILIESTGDAVFVSYPTEGKPTFERHSPSTMWRHLTSRCARFFRQ